MRIIFISGQYPPQIKGGGEISTHLIAQGLAERGHEVKVIAEGRMGEDGGYEGIKVRRGRLGLTDKPLLEKRKTKNIAVRLKTMVAAIVDTERGEDPWVVHAHDFRSAMAVVMAEIQNPVVTIRDYAFICGTTNNILKDGSRCHCTLGDVFKTQRVKEVGRVRGIARAWQYWYNVPFRKKMLAK